MALLNTTPQQHPTNSSSSTPPTPTASALSPTPLNPRTISNPIPSTPPLHLPSRKLPRGRPVTGQTVVYDVDLRLPGENQPQLEVTPITKYVSDPALVVGRQIAVNSTYICYGLKLGAIRILNINTASRALLKGHSQRVTDMAFFKEEVHLLASVSVDGRVFVWKISEGPDEDKQQITGQKIIDIQITGEGALVHPRVCWHSHKQEYLVVSIGKHVLKIDTTKVRKDEAVSAEQATECPINKLIDGVQLVGKHDGEVTDLSMCQWMTTRLVSSSTDGTVKVWEDRKELPLAVMRPHDGQPVYAAIFLIASDRPNHINLITAGPMNREVKIWASTSEEGWLLPSDTESWQCTQTLLLKSTAEPRAEDAFFNQVLALPRAGLILLANAKRNAIYAVHIEYGPYPAATHMDYIAEFTVTMPILSLTGTSDDGEHVVQVYCVQTQAIQQYALDLCQCLPSTPENTPGTNHDMDTPSSDAFGSADPHRVNASSEIPIASDAPRMLMPGSKSENSLLPRYPSNLGVPEFSGGLELPSSYVEPKQTVLAPVTTDSTNVRVASPLPSSPRMTGFTSPSESVEFSLPVNVHGVHQPASDYSFDRKVDSVPSNLRSIPSWEDGLKKDEKEAFQNDTSMASNPPIMFKHPTHLITPSEILSRAVSSTENTQVTEVIHGESKASSSNDREGINVEAEVMETGGNTVDSESNRGRKKEKTFCSQASSLGHGMASERFALSRETSLEMQRSDAAGITDALDRSQSAVEEEALDSTEDMPQKVSESVTEALSPKPTIPASRGKKQKEKYSQVSGPSSPSPSLGNLRDSPIEPESNSGVPSVESELSQILSLQNQLLSTQKEMQKQMPTQLAVLINKEARRLEASLVRAMEKSVKANNDALWARIQEENAKREKLEQERMQHITSSISNGPNKDFPGLLERTLKKELTALGQGVARLLTPILEKSIYSSITESFQRGVGDKAVSQLEKSVNAKLEATVARQIQAQFQTSGKQALQDTLRSCVEALMVPAFELSCKAMFEQIDMVFQKGLVEHTVAAQQHFDSTHSPTTLALREALSSAASITQSLSGELADGQRKLLALAAAGSSSEAVNSLGAQLSKRPVGGIHELQGAPIQHEPPVDPTKELSRMIAERKFGDAFNAALQRSDVFIVSWLCSQVDLQGILATHPLPLSQGVLLALLQQLACDVSNNTSQKLTWMRDVAMAINPTDPVIALHVRPIFEQVYQILHHHCSLPATTPAELSNIKLVMHVINSMLMSCK